jgi:hypothetical protein
MDNIEELQQEYLDASLSGDADKIKEVQNKIDAFINDGVTPNKEEPQGIVEEVQQQEVQEEPEEVAKEGDPAPEETKTDQQNWYESLPPEVKAEVEKLINHTKQLEHRIKADNGRVAAYQRRYHELQKEAVQKEEMLKRLQSQTTVNQPQGNKTPAAPQNTASLSIDDDPDLKAIAETDEQLARAILKREQLLRQEIESLKKSVFSEFEPLKRESHNAQIQSELSRLQQMIPNAIEIFNYVDPETKVNVWDDWVMRQPPAVKTLASSDNADDVARALELYGLDMQRIYGTQQEPPQQVQAPVNTQKTQQVQQERERKLQAQPVGSASVRPPQNAKPTYEELMSDPEKLLKFQDEIMREEMKKKGILR